MKGLFKNSCINPNFISLTFSSCLWGATNNLSKTNNGNQEDSSNAANSK